MRVLILLALSLAAVVADPLSLKKNGDRIIGGTETTISNYPFAAALLYSSTQSSHLQRCGGTVITTRAVVSSANCFMQSNTVDPAGAWLFRVGSSFANSGGTVHNLQSIIVHPAYNRQTNDIDIAILRPSVGIVYNSNVAAASIAGPNYNLADNQIVWAVGWGATTDLGSPVEQLRHVQIWTVNQEECSTRYAAFGSAVTDNMLCAGWLDVGGRDQCTGDSGAPLLRNNVLVGITSWGYRCGEARYPGVNTRVSSLSTWIQNNA